MLRKCSAVLAAAALFAAAPPAPKLPKEKRAIHALNRLTFGPTAADMAAVQKLGVEKWIELQLHPEKIAENPELEARLKLYDSLSMTTAELVTRYPPPQLLRNLENIKDPAMRERLERLNETRQARQPADRRKALDQILTAEQLRKLRNGTPAEKLALINSLSKENREKLLALMPGSERNQILHSSNVGLRRETIGAVAPIQVVYHDLAEAKILRAVHSNRQLEELLVDFWFNHFNVFFDKGFDRALVTAYERDAIRPHVLGQFKDLLIATSHHPAMLFYLDNWTSVSTEALDNTRRRFQRQKALPKARRASGLNENYARELLELHTLGADNGYTQKDVTEVARCFTGWSIGNLRDGARFQFNAMLHDPGPKTVLGQAILPGRGEEEGLQVLDILARHPGTAKFVSTKLAQRFVSDNPPPALIEKMAGVFAKTQGDLRQVMHTMLTSPEFWSQGAYNAKMKMPLEMIASALRATGARIDSTVELNQSLKALGQPLYRKVEPTGYYPFAEEWTNSASLLARMNLGLDLAQNKLRGTQVDLVKVLNGKSEPAAIAQALLLRPPGQETLATLRASAKSDPAHLAGLVLGGPEFQRR